MVMPTRAKIVRYWAGNGSVGVIDIGEPACFACNALQKDWGDGLERAHIVPKALGGSYAPSNLLMLCLKCHADAPDCTDPEFILDWVRRRPKCWSRLRWGPTHLSAELRGMGHPIESIPEIDRADFDKFLVGFVGTHGASISASSAAAAVVAFITKDKE